MYFDNLKPLPKYISRKISVTEVFSIRIPNIQTDELYEGWIERIRVINGLKSAWQTFCLMEAAAGAAKGAKSTTNLSYHAVGAFTASMELDHFISAHTTNSFYEAFDHREFRDYEPFEPDFKARKFKIHQRNILQAKRCEVCATCDSNKSGFSFLRREHALPGLFWCSVHQCALNWAFPSAEDHAEIPVFAGIENCSKALKCYVSLASKTVFGALKVRHGDIHAKLVLRLHAKHLLAEGVEPWSFRDFVEEHFSSEWIKATPGLHLGGPRSLERFVPHEWQGGYFSTQNYLVALAVLFDDASEAESWASKPLDSEWINTTLESQHLSAFWWQRWRNAAYQNSACFDLGRSSQNNFTDSADDRILEALGIPSISDVEPLVIAALAFYQSRDIPIESACKKFGIRAEPAHRLMKKVCSVFLRSISQEIENILLKQDIMKLVLADEHEQWRAQRLAEIHSEEAARSM